MRKSLAAAAIWMVGALIKSSQMQDGWAKMTKMEKNSINTITDLPTELPVFLYHRIKIARAFLKEHPN